VEIFNKLKKEAKTFTKKIRNLAQKIAYIDVMVSFALCAREYDFKKPTFCPEDKIQIQGGYHPALLNNNVKITPNDTNLKANSVMIITGANMIGKSTYLKQNAIICTLAQMGSFVPAKKAEFKILNSIFYRQATLDDISNNTSSFMLEMNDLKYILDNAKDNTLVLLDEPAKSTNSSESAAIIMAFLEYFLLNNSAKTILATHNFEVTKLEKQIPNKVSNFVFGCVENNQIKDRLLHQGSINQSNALSIAALAQLPDAIIKRAHEYIEKM
ncbi:MutS family DNA mismatch repair protein, partial [bacterium]|nr:MutS family DNA mismatch repair protein [bacterium]